MQAVIQTYILGYFAFKETPEMLLTIVIVLLLIIILVLLALLIKSKIKQINTKTTNTKNSDEILHNLYNQSPIMMHSIDMHGKLLYVNDYWLKTLGYSRDEVINNPSMNYYTGTSRKNYHDIFERVITQGAIHDLEGEMVKKDGTIVHVLLTAEVTYDKRNVPVQIYSILMNITERKHIEQELSEGKHKLDNILNNAAEAIFVIQNERVQYVNPATSKILGYSIDQLFNAPFQSIIHPDDREMIIQNYRKRMAGEKLEQQYCFRVVRPSGDLIWVDINAVQMAWNREPAILVFLMDMTERKSHDDMLVEQATTLREKAEIQEKLNKELRNKNKELDDHQEELSDYAEELKAVLEEIAVKNERIERTNQDMKDSIEYARIIQDAVLQTTDEINGLYDHFVLYIPKDIVSGDFYYFKKTNNLTMFAVADCTGHGVPGGFLTILGVNLLQEVITKADLTKPHQMLEDMRKKVKNVFRFSRHHDGLDISICVHDQQAQKLYYASANMPIVIINGDKTQKFMPTPNPIGYYISEIPFELQEINTMPGDTLYMLSDGIKDQFGGKSGKKYQLKNLIKLLVANNHKTMAEQKEIVFDEYKTWKGSEMQLDDITLIGVKLD